MDADGLPIIGSGVDLTKIQAVENKRTLAFLNHFISHTVQFLNQFGDVCEEKLANVSTRLQRLETEMNLLDGKINSIPGLEHISAPTADPVTSATPAESSTSHEAPIPVPSSAEMGETATAEDAVEDSPKMTVSKDPRYAKFFKMLSVGIPLMAVKQKVAMEGLDPNLLETPDAVLPSSEGATPGIAKPADDDSDVDFSDASDADDSDASAFSD